MTIWYSWLYHYGVGGAFFAFCIWLMLRTGALRPRQERHHLRLLMSMTGGLLLFMTVHALWILLAAAG